MQRGTSHPDGLEHLDLLTGAAGALRYDSRATTGPVRDRAAGADLTFLTVGTGTYPVARFSGCGHDRRDLAGNPGRTDDPIRATG